jgi:hypothetical protein
MLRAVEIVLYRACTERVHLRVTNKLFSIPSVVYNCSLTLIIIVHLFRRVPEFDVRSYIMLSLKYIMLLEVLGNPINMA